MKIARTHAGFVVMGKDGGWVGVDELGIEADTTEAVIQQRADVEGALATAPPGRDEPELLCPIVRPSKVLCIGLNYMDHIRETSSPVPERPVLFGKFPNALNDPHGEIVMDPALTEEGDYEAELAVVIGARTRSIALDDALDHVFGYAVANDVSARDWQFRDPQYARSKSFDTFCPIGPWITTADEVPDPQALAIRSWVNDELRQDSTTKEMVFSVAELIEFLARGMTLEPGDVILTGTPHGVGFAMDPPQLLVPGDIVRCDIEGLGSIDNPIVGPGR